MKISERTLLRFEKIKAQLSELLEILEEEPFYGEPEVDENIGRLARLVDQADGVCDQTISSIENLG